MNLSHYSIDRIEALAPQSYLQRSHMKPSGFWLSVDGEDDWAEWCVGETFRPHALKYRHVVTLKDGANILHLCTPDEVIQFSKEYYDREIKAVMDAIVYINWSAVAREYAGIIIAPYQWSLRLDNRDTSWYYSWDCASGCIWDLDAIETIRCAGETDLPAKIASRLEERGY